MGMKVIHGNIFDSKAPVLVNPVNCVGVMGKGLAKEFKERYPDMFKAYKKLCDEGGFEVSVTSTHPFFLFTDEKSGIKILNFPTKIQWKNPSQLDFIESMLKAFRWTYKDYGIEYIAFPALGCGCGGLSWDDVRPLMTKYLANLPIQIEVYIK